MQGKTEGLQGIIKRVLVKRMMRGATKTSLINWLKHLKTIHRYDERTIDSYILELTGQQAQVIFI